MNIVSVKNIAGQQDYLLKEDGTTVLKLRYKKDMHTARVETEKERRVLIIDDEGLLKTRLILKNEYGVRIGSLSYDNFSDTHGSVEIENLKYRFIITHLAAPELKIYKGSDFPVFTVLVITPACSSLKWITKLSADEKFFEMADCLQLQNKNPATRTNK